MKYISLFTPKWPYNVLKKLKYKLTFVSVSDTICRTMASVFTSHHTALLFSRDKNEGSEAPLGVNSTGNITACIVIQQSTNCNYQK